MLKWPPAIVHSGKNRDLAIARGLGIISTVQLFIHEDEK